MRLFGAVVAIAGMVWLVAGCGDAIALLLGKICSGLIPADTAGEAHCSFTVVNGASAHDGAREAAVRRTWSAKADSLQE